MTVSEFTIQPLLIEGKFQEVDNHSSSSTVIHSFKDDWYFYDTIPGKGPGPMYKQIESFLPLIISEMSVVSLSD